ncbi:MAG: YheC/YheD family protein [Deltaproteobacteria bacterium]
MPRNRAGVALPKLPKSDYPQTANGTRASVRALVGVLTSGKNINQGIPTGKKARIFREMTQHAKQKEVDLFFFYLEDVNWKQRTIKGLVLSGNKNWVMRTYPFPDIVYNRILYRNIENTEYTRRLLRRFEMEKDLELFNTRFLEKWEVYQAFKRSGQADDLLPETDLFSRRTLDLYCHKYGEVFLKPRNGSKGKGIIKVTRGPDGRGFIYARAENAKNDKSRHCGGLESLYRELKAIGVSDKRYLVQRGIDLATYQGRVFDIRSQVQKDGSGQWVFTGAGARVAARNSFVTHIPNGGHLADLQQVLTEVFGPSQDTVKAFFNNLSDTTVAAGQILDQQLGINLAILSLDVAADREGRMWILEINSKPASFDEDDIRYRHFDYLMDYARYIGYKKYMRIDD